MNCEQNLTANKKPLILNIQKWNSILKQLTKKNDLLYQNQQEKKYIQYVKEGSQNITSKWKNTFTKGVDVSLLEKKKLKSKEKALEYQKTSQEIKDNDERIRHEKIDKAQQMIQKLKAEPLALEKAAILSEVLKAREIQNKIHEKFIGEIEAENNNIQNINMKSNSWFVQHQNRSILEQIHNIDYKNELYNSIKDQRQNKIDYLKTLSEGERKLSEGIDVDVKVQIEHERVVLQRKKELMRKNALEAMKMVEQRRLRDKLENNVEDAINTIYIHNKQKIFQIKQNIKNDENKLKDIKLDAKNLLTLKTNTNKDEDLINQRVAEEINAKLDLQQQEKINKERKIKAAKINFYIQESQRKKEEKKLKLEKRRWCIANRLKNEEINKKFHLNCIQQKIQKSRENREYIINQIEEKRIRKINDDQCNPFVYHKDDKFFFQYADKLMENAKVKSRSILPFIKEISKYKKTNGVDPQKFDFINGCNDFQTIDHKISKTIEKPVLKYNLCELKQLDPTTKLNLL